MIQEILMRGINDSRYNLREIETNDVIEAIITKINMILSTKPGEVLGNPHFGVDLESLVFSLNASNSTIQKLIEEQIQSYVPERLVCDISVEVQFVNRVTYDAAIVDIMIDGRAALQYLIS